MRTRSPIFFRFLGIGLAWIFLIHHAQAGGFDSSHQAWDQILKRFARNGRVNYAGLKAEPQTLESYLESLGSLKESEVAAWSRNDQIAFWVNAYNALTLKVIIDNYPIQPSFPASLRYPKNSIRQISGVWDEDKFLVAGKAMTLNDIEHKTLREKFHEPRIHMVLVCASIGCPPLRGEAFVGSKLDAQLEDQARTFLGTPSKFKIDREAGRIYLSPIFKWFGEDFNQAYSTDKGFPGHRASEKAVLNFISRYLDENDAAFLRDEKFDVKYLDYDWSLNEAVR